MKSLTIDSIKDGVSVTCNGETFSIIKSNKCGFDLIHLKTHGNFNTLKDCVDYINGEFRSMFGDDVGVLNVYDIGWAF